MDNIPEIGLHHNVPFETYLSWDAVSASRLKLATKSMAHYKLGFQGEPTKAMRFGTLCHTGQLEPLSIADRYAVLPEFHLDEENITANGSKTNSKATKYYREKVQQFESANRDKTIIDKNEFDLMVGLVKALAGNDLARTALSGDVEVSIVWKDKSTGLLCKCRCDALNLNKETVGDLKTTDDCTRFGFAVRKWGYHVQMAHYCIGIRQVTGVDVDPWLVPVEKAPPFGNMAAPLSINAIRIGERIRRDCMKEIASCMKTNHWPGYVSPVNWDVQEPSLPVEVTIGGATVTI